MTIPYIFPVIDFNSPVSCGHSDFEGMADELRQNRLCAVDRVSSGSRIPKVRRPIPRGVQGPEIHLSRPVPLHGLRAADVSRKPAGHRNLPEGRPGKALPHWHPGRNLPNHSGEGQRKPRLAHLCRLRTGTHPNGKNTVRERSVRGRVGADGIRPRLHDDRSVPLPLPVGEVPETEGGRQAPHASGLAGEHPLVHQDYRRQVARRQRPGRTDPRAGIVLRDGPRISGLRTASSLLGLLGLLHSAFFIIRAKKNLCYRRLYSTPVDKTTGVRSDQTIVLTGVNTAEHYPDKLRRIRFVDAETRKNLVFLYNDFSLPPESIALLYKQRWQVELFFRWIKQHLRIKAFFGTSENAVKTQVWIAISVYVLVAIIRKRLNLDWSLYTILQILSIAVFEKEPIIQILTNSAHHDLCPESGELC